MANCVPRKDFSELLSILSQSIYGEQSYPILELVKSEEKFNIGHEFWTNRWPDFSVLVAVPPKRKGKRTYMNDFYGVVTTNRDDFQDILACTDLFRWTEIMCVIMLPLELSPMISSVAQAKDVECSITPTYFMTATKSNLRELPNLPLGYMLGKLYMEHADQVNREWEHGNCEESLSYMKFMISNMPNMAITDSSGNLVAYELVYHCGAMANLYVTPEHRGKGLAKYVTIALANSLLDSGLPAFAFVVQDNKASVRLHEACGFCFAPGGGTMFPRFSPKET